MYRGLETEIRGAHVLETRPPDTAVLASTDLAPDGVTPAGVIRERAHPVRG